MNQAAVGNMFRPSQRASWATGQPISELMAQALANPDLISLAAGFVDQATLPSEVTRQAFSAIFSNDEQARACLQYGTNAGDDTLRELLLARALDRCDPLPRSVSIDNLVMTSGSNQLLHLVAESLLNPGDAVLCAAPTYLVFLGTLANLGVRSVGIETDEQGMIPESLDEYLAYCDRMDELSRVKAVYLVPYFDNPRGITMPAHRVQGIVEIAQRWSSEHRIHVIVDEAYRELRYRGTDEPGALSMDEEGATVIVAGTFSKSFSPGIRVGWGILPEHLTQPVLAQKGNIDFGSPNLNQQIMARVLLDGRFDAHVKQLRVKYAEKLSATLAAADEFLSPIPGVRWNCPDGGLYVWVELPTDIDTGPSGRLLELSVNEGVLYVPGQYSFPDEGIRPRRNTMRLSFGVQTTERIQLGMEALGRAIQQA